jgi:ubiquinone/menaquinone biosynthesis C-methylase UbiE
VILSAREGYRHWASTYDDTPNPIVSLVDRNFDLGDLRGKIIIDVACGTGRRTMKIGAIGVDLSFEMLARGEGRFVQADALCLPFAGGAADLTLCTLALGYISPVREVMTELCRITRRGGAILAADVHPEAIAAGWKRSFRDGPNVYEIENHAYSFEDLGVDGLVLEAARDLYFGEPERAIYDHAGKAELFERAREVPAAWIRRWIRR